MALNLKPLTSAGPGIDAIASMLCQPGSPFELVDQVVNGVTVPVWKNTPPDMRTYLLLKFREHSDKEFLSSPLPPPAPAGSRENLTFGEVLRPSLDLAAWMRGEGVKKGDFVALGGFNSTGWVVSWVAIHLLLAVPVYLNSTLEPDAQTHCLKLTKPVMVLIDDRVAERVGPTQGELKKLGVGKVWCWSSTAHLPKHQKVDAIPTLNPDPKVVAAIEAGTGLGHSGPDDDGCIFFTSGTTGYPKAVLSTVVSSLHTIVGMDYTLARAVLRTGASMKDLQDFIATPQPQAVNLVSIPLFHVTGCLTILMAAFARGAKLVFMRSWSVKDAVELVQKEKVTGIGGVPAIATAIIQSPLLPKEQEFATVMYGGAPPPTRLPGDIQKRWPASMIGTGWGMTETNAPATHVLGQDYVDRPSTCGAPLPNCAVKVVCVDTGRELGRNEVGLLCIKGSNTMKEYYGNEKATKETLVNGWVNTGDIGLIDDDHYVHILDRQKDIIIRGGENIPSAEVESALALDDRLAEVAAVPVPDEVMGELVGACVSLRPNATATEAEVLAAVNKRLRPPARPVIVIILTEDLPRNANGKIVKKDVRTIVQTEYARRNKTGKTKGAARAKL